MRRIIISTMFLLLASVAGARPIDDAQAEFSASEQRLVEAEAAQRATSAAHDALAHRISALKAGEMGLAPGMRHAQLDDLLKQARAEAAQLRRLDERAVVAQAGVDSARGVLRSALDDALVTTRSKMPSSEGADRVALFEALQRLVARRAGLGQAPRALGSLAVAATVEADGASAEELRELADEAQDDGERVLVQLAAIEAHLGTLVQRRRMMRATQAFQRDEALFAEDQRNRRLVFSTRPSASRGTAVNRGDEAQGGDDEVASPAADPSVNGDGAMAGGEPEGRDDSDDYDGMEADGDSDLASGGPIDAPPPSGEPTGTTVVAEMGDESALTVEAAFDLSLLETGVQGLSSEGVSERMQRVRAERARLKAQAEALTHRRARLEARAHELERE